MKRNCYRCSTDLNHTGDDYQNCICSQCNNKLTLDKIEPITKRDWTTAILFYFS